MPGNIMSPVGPNPIYCKQGDALILNISTPKLGTVNVFGVANTWVMSWRMLLPSGELKDFNTPNFNPNASAGSAQVAETFALQEGWLLTVNITIFGNLPFGACLSQVFLARNLLTIPNALQATVGTVNCAPYLLISSTLSGNQSAAWPTTPCKPVGEGPAFIITDTVGNPAAGANFSFALPVGYRIQILNVFFTLVTSAAAGNRFAQITLKTGSTIWATACASAAQIASVTGNYNFAAGTGAVNAAISAILQEQIVPLANGLQSSSEGSTLASSIYGLLAGDQISAIAIRSLYWNENI